MDLKKLCAYDRAKLPIPNGWAEDKRFSDSTHNNIIVPIGSNFNNAKAIIYANASGKQKLTLDAYIHESHQQWKKANPNSKITTLKPMRNKQGNIEFKVHVFQNPSKKGQELEIVASCIDKDKYGNEYFITIVLSGQNQAAIMTAKPLYIKVLQNYK